MKGPRASTVDDPDLIGAPFLAGASVCWASFPWKNQALKFEGIPLASFLLGLMCLFLPLVGHHDCGDDRHIHTESHTHTHTFTFTQSHIHS